MPKIGDMKIFEVYHPDAGFHVHEVRAYRECTGEYAPPGKCDWFTLTLEPFATVEEALAFVDSYYEAKNETIETV